MPALSWIGQQLCRTRWGSRSKHRGTDHLCSLEDGHTGRHRCACGMVAK